MIDMDTNTFLLFFQIDVINPLTLKSEEAKVVSL